MLDSRTVSRTGRTLDRISSRISGYSSASGARLGSRMCCPSNSGASSRTSPENSPCFSNATRRSAANLLGAMQNGMIKAPNVMTYALAEAAKVQQDLESRRTSGSVELLP